MNYLPIFLDISEKTCLVVGGGDVALRKCTLLQKCQAKIKLVSPTISAELKAQSGKYPYQFLEREYQQNDLDGCALVVAATDSAGINFQIYTDATLRNIPVNVVDQPELCSFIFPSIIDRHPITIAVSSGGTSPILARLLRARLETLIPENYGKLAELAGKFRSRVKLKISSVIDRRHFWEKILQGPAAELVFSSRGKEAEAFLDLSLAEFYSPQQAQGEVYLVGAGPGDPDLLTFRALRLMQQADIVFYDNLVSKPILDLVRKDAKRVYVGKKKSSHTLPQQEINKLLAEHARQGMKVLRLKGGDPFIFGRGGEEIEELAEQGIRFQVVPGITAASGCAAYAGIPLTHRDYAQSVRFLTGHLKDDSINLQWPELMDVKQTLVFYMGLTGLKEICAQLIQHGRDPLTPIALIEKGTTTEQRVFISTLVDLPASIANQDIKAPTLTIVGNVVSLHKKLSWFGA
jgi:uroporphyrin-III C-methyltransferase/precorrin-2 dehydrogenase/sirohydrochlorin ferrochelatase